LAVVLFGFSALTVCAATHYVWQSSPGPAPPFLTWATAAMNIQDAVDAAVTGDEIVVTNGSYATGGQVDPSGSYRCVVVDKPLTLQSVNGPQTTVIDGGSAVGCVYLTNGATLFGFTLTNGVAGWEGGGGVYCESTNAVLSNCVLSGNSASEGGGAYGGTLNNCTLTGNWAQSRRGAMGMWAAGSGGGAYGCALNNCTLTGNWANAGHSVDGTFVPGLGGGAYSGTLNNCTLTGNWAAWGGGAEGCALDNCVVSGNTGDGADGSTLNNCTVTGNSGWGASYCTLNNCIVYFNSDPNGGNYDPSSTLNYCCTTPLPTNGVGNISAGPQLASASHLSAESPCIGAGSATYATGTDIDGDAWANPPSIGCDEYHAGAVTGPLTVGLTAALMLVPTGFPVGLTALIEGRTDLSVWDFGDGSVQVNEPYTSHSWTAPGDYLVALWAFNESYPEGVSATVTVHVEEHPVQYVALGSRNPAAPYTSWATAATNIQDAVDVAPPGATIFVTTGAYAPVSVNKPLTLQSVNGPGVTIINGGGTQGCVYLTSGAAMAGFTLTNGVAANWYGGGVYCESSAVVSNCVLTGNSAYGGNGGGAYGGRLNNCTLTGNWADDGGGAYDCTLNNCTLTGNSAPGGDGGGACVCTLNNCTLTGNSATGQYAGGGGAWLCTLNNCIVYFNSAPVDGNYDPSSMLNYCCTTPLPTNSVGNLSADPQLASTSHLSAESPCIGAGSATYATGTDIDGDAWANPPSIGCDEYHAGAVTGPLTVSLTATFTNVAIGFPVGLTALIAGRTDLSVWEFGDGSVRVNEPYTSHAWTAPGYYLVALWAFNESYPGGVSATLMVHVVEDLHYVAASSGNPVAPYTSWATAATNIQDAVNVALPGATIFVTNGTYAPISVNQPLTVQSVNGPGVTVINGGGTQECVYLTNNAIMVGFTLTNGVTYGSGGGVFCESKAVLTNCVLTGNSAWGDSSVGAYGGGACGGTLNNCTLSGNSAAYWGGGAWGCMLNNCKLTGNSATYLGGGAWGCTLNNCTLTGNSSWYGGGAYDSTLNNCIVYFNTAANGANYYQDQYGRVLTYCCTTPMPTNGMGNIANAPLFVDQANGNLRLQSNSPCINAGNNAYVTNSTDLDGNPRIVGGTVDIGAYEYQTPTSIISYAWLQQYGLPTDGSADYADTDGNGMNNWQKWIAGLNPTNALSVLKMTSATKTNNPAGLVVTWESVNTRTYYLQSSTNLAAQSAFSTIQSNIVGQAGTTSYTDTNAVGSGPYFYRVGVGN
jgi:hypothetical protein